MRHVAFFLGVVLLLAGCGGGSPQSTVKEFFRNVEAGKLDDAAEMFSKATLSGISLDKMKQGLQQSTREIDSKGGISKIEIVDHKTIGEVAEVTVKIRYGNDTEEVENLNLVKEDGDWKLQAMGDK